MMRAIAYARFSSDQQSDKSCADQLRECRKFAVREGYEVVETFEDRAISGALLDQRLGILAVLERIQKGDIDVVIAEALDRVSRDLEHVAGIFKRLSFWNVKLHTISEGVVSEMALGMRGTMASMLLRDIAVKTHRGLKGRVIAGFSAGGKTFGYRLVRKKDGSKYEIDPTQAPTVREIFKLFVSGKSPAGIAAELNQRGVVSPNGKGWSSSTIYGNPAQYVGLLCNELYAGRLIWNRREWRKDPSTGKAVARMRDPSEWVVVDLRECRIIDQKLWAATQARMREVGAVRTTANSAKRHGGRYPVHLLSGLLRCSECGGAFSMINGNAYGCGTRANRGADACSNNRTIERHIVEEAVLIAVRDDLFNEQGMKMAEAIIRKRLLARTRDQNAEQRGAKVALARVETEIGNILAAMRAGIVTSSTKSELLRLEGEKARLAAALKVESVDFGDIQKFLPEAIASYRKAIETLTKVGMTYETTKARQAIADLVGGSIMLEPAPDGGLNAILRGDYNAMLQLARRKSEARKTSVVLRASDSGGARGHAGPTVSHVW
jgi:DNA invertase Pin-like site-specific DNA recombinase